MRVFIPFAKVDAERREVWGYASTEARDDQGEIVRRDAIEAALGDYMQFANIREMHQLSAVGVAKEAAVDDKGLYVGAKIVDPAAWEKVLEGVYKGYSIGGRVTARDPADYKTITGLTLTEISIVDRPSNPEAVFDYFKATATDAVVPGLDPGTHAKERGSMPEPFNPPIQVWTCADPAHRHLAKAEAARCLAKAAADPVVDQIRATIDGAYAAAAELEEAAKKAEAAKGGDEPGDGGKPYGDVEYADPGYQEDKKKRYPIDTEAHIRAAWSYINKKKNADKYSAEQVKSIKAKIVAAWKEKIDKDGPPEASGDKTKTVIAEIGKALADAGGVAQIILSLDWLKDLLETEAAMEGDDSPQPARLQAIIAELCAFLVALVAEETAEVIAGDEVDPLAVGYGGIPYVDGVMLAAMAQTLRKAGKEELAVKLEKATQHEAAMLHMAHHAVAKATEMGGLSDEKMGHLHATKLSLAAAAGEDGSADEHSTVDSGNAAEHPAPTKGGPDPTGKAAGMAIDTVAKHGGHQALMDLAHHCIKTATDGAVCGAMKAHSAAVMAHLHKAHLHLTAAGAKCDAEPEMQGTVNTDKAAAAQAELAKTTEENARLKADNAELVKSLAAITGSLAQLQKRVEDIAAAPMPPATMARVPASAAAMQTPTEAEIAKAWELMTPDERAYIEIVNALGRPITGPMGARMVSHRGT